MIDKRTCFVVFSLLYLMSVDGFPIYGELDVNESGTKETWKDAEDECVKNGLRLTNYLTVESLTEISHKNLDYWIGGKKDKDGKCPMLSMSSKSRTFKKCDEPHYFLCSPQAIANMNHVIMIAVGAFTIINMILVTICVLRRLCKKKARLPKEEKPKVTSKKDKKERKKKDKRQKKDAKVSEDIKQETPAAGDAEAPKQAGDDAQTVQTTAVVEAGAAGAADVDTTSTTPAAAASTTAEAEAGKEEKLPDPPEFILNDTTSTATTTVATDSTAASVAVVTAIATAVVTATGTGVADTGIVSSSITTTETSVNAAKEADKKDLSCQEAGKVDPGKVVTTSEDKPSLMAEMEAILLGQSTGNKQGEATPVEPPLPPPPEEVIKSDTTTVT